MKIVFCCALVVAVYWSSLGMAYSDDIFHSGVLDTYVEVDKYMANGGNAPKQLSMQRAISDRWDRATQPIDNWSFARAIGEEIVYASRPRKADLENWYLNLFRVPLNHMNDTVSLTDQNMCTHSIDDFEYIFRSGRQITEIELVKVNELVDIHNRHAVNGNDQPPIHLHALFGCLAYAESLGDPDTSTSIARARTLLGNAFVKPGGVKFYYDRRHSNPRSRWNIGLYQFVAHSRGNIAPCIAGWNSDSRANPSLPIGNLKRLAPFMGSSGQTLNAYCGVHKILETFYIQKYTNDLKRVHPNNIRADSSLKDPADRCVSLHASFAYRHFGPLDRSDGTRTRRHSSNLDKVLSCTLSVSKTIWEKLQN